MTLSLAGPERLKIEPKNECFSDPENVIDLRGNSRAMAKHAATSDMWGDRTSSQRRSGSGDDPADTEASLIILSMTNTANNQRQADNERVLRTPPPPPPVPNPETELVPHVERHVSRAQSAPGTGETVLGARRAPETGGRRSSYFGTRLAFVSGVAHYGGYCL